VCKFALKVRTDGTMETRLFMRRARPTCFRSYRLFAENDVGTTTAETELLQRTTVSEKNCIVLFAVNGKVSK